MSRDNVLRISISVIAATTLDGKIISGGICGVAKSRRKIIIIAAVARYLNPVKNLWNISQNVVCKNPKVCYRIRPEREEVDRESRVDSYQHRIGVEYY